MKIDPAEETVNLVKRLESCEVVVNMIYVDFSLKILNQKANMWIC